MPGSIVDYPANGKQNRGYLALPDGSGPGVIVIQEWWGLVPHIEDVCERFAREGFVAFAPDLYHGESTKSPDEAGKKMMALNIDRAEADLRGAVRTVVGHERCSTDTVGVIGFCMGGQLALYAASKNPEIAACADFYGVHPHVKPDYAGLRGPVLGVFAENDGMVNAQVVRDLDAKLTRAGVPHDFHTYPGTDHAFFNDQRPEVHDAAAAKDAWQRVLRLFRDHVR